MFRRLVLVTLLGAPLLAFGPPAAAATPTADSGPDVVVEAGTDAVLAGSAADADGDPLQIKWLRSVVSGGDLTSCTFSGPLAFEPISAPGLAPTLSCTTPGQYLLQLVAADGTTSFDDLGALVTFTPAVNDEPMVDSGPDITTPAGTDAVLAGSASDPDGDPLEIRWIRTVVSGGDLTSCTFTGPTAFAPISAAGLAPTFNCTVPGEYLVQLVAGDGITSVDDIGALVTFTVPVDDLTAPTCSAVGPAPGGGFVLRVADSQSGVSMIRTQRRFNAVVRPSKTTYSPSVASADLTIRQRTTRRPAVVHLRVTNTAGLSGTCVVVVHGGFVSVVNV
jgi:hypothetical protein